MPQTLHPKDVALTPTVTPSSDYSMTVNGSQVQGFNQANQTYVLTATNGTMLGVNGETRAYGKQQVDAMSPNLGATTAILFAKYDAGDDGATKKTAYLSNPLAGGDRGMLTRQVATYETDKFLGLNSVTEEKFGLDGTGKVIGISVQADGAAVSGKTQFLDIDYSDPKIQRGLSDLQVSDYITGQIDRHSGNIFVDPVTGKVTGIDNDMGFPEVDLETMAERDRGLAGKLVVSMPDPIHKDTAAKILSADPNELRTMLQKAPPKQGAGGPQPLSPEAIEGAVQRLEKLQRAIKNGEIKVVKEFNKQTYDTAVKKQVDTYNNDRLNKKYGHTFDGGEVGDSFASSNLKQFAKTSYIGTVVTEKRVNSLAPNDKRLGMTQTGPQADRIHPRDVAQNMGPDRQRALAYKQMTPKQQKDFDKQLAALNKLEASLDKTEAHLSHLQNNPSMKDRFTSITKGGITGAKNSDVAEINKLKTKISNQESQLTQTSLDSLPKKTTVTQTVPQQTVPQTITPTVTQQTTPQVNVTPQVTTPTQQSQVLVPKVGDVIKMKITGTNPQQQTVGVGGLKEGDTVKMNLVGSDLQKKGPGVKTAAEQLQKKIEDDRSGVNRQRAKPRVRDDANVTQGQSQTEGPKVTQGTKKVGGL